MRHLMAMRSGMEKVTKKVINVLSLDTTLGNKITILYVIAFILTLVWLDYKFYKRDSICFVHKTYEYPQIFIIHSYVLRA